MNVCDARHGFRGHRFALRILAHREVELGERGVTALANFPLVTEQRGRAAERSKAAQLDVQELM